ncbi:MAG: hypothetical protein U0X91_28520 [Spirosomataceae bacterium]
MQKFLPRFFSFFLVCFTACGQTAESGSATSKNSLPLDLYQSATSLSPHLYNGARYHIYDSRSKDHQFYESEEWSPGSVLYDSQSFEAVPMLYDIVKDKVVIKYQNRSGLIQLQSERVARFSYLNHRFIRLERNEAAGVDIPTGFYDLLYDGKLQVLARRVKQRQEQIENNRVNVYFLPKNFYYIKKDGVYHPIPSKKAALSLLEEQKKALKKHLRDQGIKYRKARESAIVQMATKYDQLLHP